MKVHSILLTTMLFSSAVYAQNNRPVNPRKAPDQVPQNQGEMIFNQLLNAFNQSADEVVALFHHEAVIEFPYAPSLGTASKLNFKEYHNYMKGALSHMPGIHFENARVYQVNKNTYWAEVHGEAHIPSTGKLYQQDYVIHFTLKEDKINFYKEYWDPVAGIKAFGNQKAMEEIFNTKNN